MESVYFYFHAVGQISSRYDGEVFLFPPKEKHNGLQPSFGVIQINITKNIKALVAMNSLDVAKHFYKTRRDTLCRQMGYTEAVTDSVYTINALKDLNFSGAKR